ncbi:MAG: NAD(P)-binding domain-containing protein, partial [Spirochaetes bacterium]|nr:NAD(P)-binding domain-containing protein [Spirochaetota bacterium]
MSAQIGFIGLGVMGGPMASNLSSKFPGIRVFDTDASKIQRLVKTSDRTRIIPAASISEIGSSCETVILSLPTSEVVKTVILGDKGLAQSLKPGSIVIDTGTTEVKITQEIAAALSERGLRFLDAPVSGGEKAAIEGTLSFMVGGEEGAFETCKPYLSAMGASVVRVGGTGMGQVAKCVNQMIVGATFAVIAESFALGAKAGLDPKVLYDAIKGGWAGSKLLDVAARDMFSREFKPGGTVDIHWKDLG